MSNIPVSDLKFHSEARSKMIDGVEKLSNAVSVTLGPKGKNVAISRAGHFPHLTKDGVTVANSINLVDPYENLGCQIVKEAAQRSADVAGDGTTTSTVVSANLLKEGSRLLETGYDAKQVILGIETACSDVLAALEDTRLSLDVYEQLASVATISANGEAEIGKIIADAIQKVGADGPISVENAKGFKTQLEIVEGTVVDRGYLSPYFSTDQTKNIAELEKPLIFIYNQVLSSAKEILPVLEKAASVSRPLLIVANDVTSEALKTLVLNKVKGSISVCAIKAPEFGSARTFAMQDLAVVCGAEVVAVDLSENPLADTSNVLGSSDRVVVDKHGTLFIGTSGDKEKIRERIESCQETLSSSSLSESDESILRRRIRRMSEGVAIIRVGGATEIEMYERRDRVDDALCASRAAKKSGIQPGGGSALVQAAKKCKKRKTSGSTDSFNAGYNSFLKACQAPMRQIVTNAGEVPEIVLRKILKSSTPIGYNASTGEYGDMLEMNIIDPHEVVGSSISHATSVVCNILSIGCAITIQEKDTSEGLGLIEEL